MASTPRWFLDGTLALARPHLDTALVSGPAWNAVLDIARLVPAALADVVYLECRLARDQSRVDLIIRVGPQGTPAHSDWATMRALTPAVDSIWLELDADRVDPLAPMIFVGFDERKLAPPPTLALLVTAVVSRLARQPLPAILTRAMSRALRAFPMSASVPYVGYLAAREPPIARLYARGIPEQELAQCLGIAGWRGPHELLTSLVTSIGATGVAVGIVHLDIAPDGSLPRVGIEYTFDRPCQRRREIAEQRLLEWLVDRGLCTPEKRTGLCAFPGIAIDTAPHELWPSRIERRVNCVKLAMDAGGRLEAKGYCRQAMMPM